MHFTLLEKSLWLAIASGELALLAIILRKDLWRRFPIFSAYVAFDVLRELARLAAAVHSPQRYFYVYWGLALAGSIIHLAVIFELCHAIYRPLEAIPRPALAMGAVCGAAIAMATVLWCWGVPLNMARSLPLWAARWNLLLTCLRFAMFAFVAAFSRILGLQWRHYVFGIAMGLGIYSSVDLVATAVHAQLDIIGAYVLHQISKIAYLLAIAAWCRVLCGKEPTPPITPEIRALLSQFRSKLKEFNNIVGAPQ